MSYYHIIELVYAASDAKLYTYNMLASRLYSEKKKECNFVKERMQIDVTS